MRTVDNGKGCAFVGAGVYDKSLPSAQFCCDLKLLQKIVLKKDVAKNAF